jgi:hypothetical protein
VGPTEPNTLLDTRNYQDFPTEQEVLDYIASFD